jgi:hypothetical protein
MKQGDGAAATAANDGQGDRRHGRTPSYVEPSDHYARPSAAPASVPPPLFVNSPAPSPAPTPSNVVAPTPGVIAFGRTSSLVGSPPAVVTATSTSPNPASPISFGGRLSTISGTAISTNGSPAQVFTFSSSTQSSTITSGNPPAKAAASPGPIK